MTAGAAARPGMDDADDKEREALLLRSKTSPRFHYDDWKRWRVVLGFRGHGLALPALGDSILIEIQIHSICSERLCQIDDWKRWILF